MLTCVRCEKQMTNILAEGTIRPGHQPVYGLAFATTGHYGSTYFDPMDGTYLELSICDPCVEDAERKGHVFRSHPAGRAALEEKQG